MSRIMSHATILSAPSGGGPIAKDTAHCGQKQIRFADDFCRGFTPTVCANMYTATDFCPVSISRLHRRHTICCTSGLSVSDEMSSYPLISARRQGTGKYG